MTVDGEDGQTWAQRRREAAAAQGERLARDQAQETDLAREQVRRFTEQARAIGLPTVELKAVDTAGRRYRSGLRGWLLRNDGRSAVSEDGDFYLLGFVGGPGARLSALMRGVRLEPSDPPLVMGRGGRDGESIPLAELLSRQLARGGDDGADPSGR